MAVLKTLLAIGAIGALAAPALADEYFVVQASDLHCDIVKQVPKDGTAAKVVSGSFRTKDAAEREMEIVCKTNSYSRELESRISLRDRALEARTLVRIMP
jgi:hypothetical protein